MRYSTANRYLAGDGLATSYDPNQAYFDKDGNPYTVPTYTPQSSNADYWSNTLTGKTKQPQYRIVAADSRSPRDGRFIEIVGHYNPRTEPSTLKVDNDKAVKWLQQGAQPTDRVRKLLEISGALEEFGAAKASS